jgi:hypothetical protein
MATLRKSRAGARSWVTLAANIFGIVCGELGGENSVSDVQCLKLRDSIDDFDKRVAVLDQRQGELEAALPSGVLESDIDEAFMFLCKSKESRLEAVVLMSKFAKVKDTQQVECSIHFNVSLGSVGGVRLPKLELPKFDGTITDWQTFWDTFEALVDKTALPTISKCAYIQSMVI